MTTCFLREGSDSIDKALKFSTIHNAKLYFYSSATELAHFGQAHEATLHLASSRKTLDEYPDYALSLGAKGGLVCEKC